MYQKKRDKRSIQSSEWIYTALKDLMSEKDFSKITITDIVKSKLIYFYNFILLQISVKVSYPGSTLQIQVILL